MWHGPCLNKHTSSSLELVKDIVRILEHLRRDERWFHFLKQNLSLDTRQHNYHLLCYMFGGSVNSQCHPYSPWKELELENINFCRRPNDFCRFPISLMKPSNSNTLLVISYLYPSLCEISFGFLTFSFFHTNWYCLKWGFKMITKHV